MSWFGALTGGAIGAMVGGPWGAALGALFGHWAEGKLGTQQKVSAADEKQALFVIAMFSCLAKLAKADGVVNRQEAVYIRGFIERQFATHEREAIRRIFNTARDNEIPYRWYIDRMAESSPDRSLLQQFLGVLCELAMADGNLDAREMEILLYAERRFGYPGYVDAFFGAGSSPGQGAAAESTLAAYYEVLGCVPSATDRELKDAWRKKCAEFHPDKIQAKGLPPEFIEFAKSEMQRINRAYDELKKSRGFK
ncbi:MAG: DnaJ domain-containing protein [Lentisphaeria bacterium]|nr:DnaJ domain-containing protein [Lentisphaeria bacterium]